MTFLHKLAKRLAIAPAAPVLFFLAASCGEASAHDYLGPDANGSHNLVSVSVSPREPLVALGDSVHFEALGWFSNGQSTTIQVAWSATGGAITSNGWFRPASIGQFTVRAASVAKPSLRDSVRVSSSLLGGIARLEISPAVTAVPMGTTQQFTVQAVMQDGTTTIPTVTWSATGGTITPNGLFTASGAIGTATVSATLGGGIATASSQITIQPPMLTQLLLDPSVATMETGEARQLTLGASWSDGSSTLPAVIWKVEGGTLGPNNVYTAGNAPGSYRLIVSSPAFSRADTAVVWVLPRLVGLRLSPSSATLLPGATQPMQAIAIRSDGSESPAGVQWSATGGAIALSGVYTAGSQSGGNRVIATLHGLNGQVFADTAQMEIAGSGGATLTQVSVTPKTAVVVEGNPLQFAGSGNLSDGRTVVPAIDWNATGGSIDTTGLYLAPQTTGSFRVIGRHRGGSKADTAIVVVGPNLVAFRVAPKIDTLVTGQTHQFSATLTWSDGLSHPATITWSTTGGVISESGAYSPGALVGSFLVVAACSCGAADTAAVAVRSSSPPASPTLMSLNLQPAAVALALGGMQQFSPTGTWSDGNTGQVGVLYVATGGSISASGFYVAGTTAGTYSVIAIQQGGSKADTSVVTINSGPTLNQLVLNPGSVTLAPGATQQFGVAGSWSDGSSTAPTVAYSATGGTVAPDGLYTAGTTAGTYRVIAAQQAGTLADTAVVTISAPAGPTLTQLVMNPSSATVLPGATQQFAVAASWSDGSSTLPALTFSATGGSVSAGGLFTAGAASGTYRVIVQGGGKADTSAITIPALTTLVLTPGSASVAPTSTLLFSVSGTWSNGSTATPTVTYTATGGTISPAGLYTAGSTTGSYQVIARQSAGTLADTTAVTISGSAPPPPSWAPTAPALPALLNTTYVAPSGSAVNVGVGGNLQSAINSANCGDEILLSPGATYTGNFVLPARQCGANPIHIRTAGLLPPEGVRVSPAVAAGFAKLVSPTTDAALKAAIRSRGWRITAVEITVTPTLTLNYGILRIGEGTETAVTDFPGRVVIDRAYVHGNALGNIQRCIAFNGDSTAVIDSYVSECHAKGFEAQAVAGWQGSGPFKIVNNYLEGSGENILFGGADPRITGLVPSDIEVRRNYLFKPLSWLPGKIWTVKNLFELKNAKRVLVEGNVLENCWVDAQVGYGILLQSAGDSPAAGWMTVQDVTFRMNLMRASASGINMLSTAHSYETPMARISFTDNVLVDIGRSDLLGEGKLLQILGGPYGIRDLRIDHNTLLHSQLAGTQQGAAILMDGSTATRTTNLVLTNSLFSVGSTGLYGNGVGVGTVALNTYSTPWDFRGNALAHDPNSSVYPSGNLFPSSVSALSLDSQYRLGTQLKGVDGRDVGADITALQAVIAGVSP